MKYISKFNIGISLCILVVSQFIFAQKNELSHERIMMSLANQQIDLLKGCLESESKVSITDNSTFIHSVVYTPSKDELKAALSSAELMKEADNLAFADKYDEAIIKYNEAIKDNPFDPFLVMTLGNAYNFKKDFKNACILYNKAIIMAPTDYSELTNLKGKLKYCN